MESVRRLATAITTAKEKMGFGNRQDRRGTFSTIAYGISYGGGQKVCVSVSTLGLSDSFTLSDRAICGTVLRTYVRWKNFSQIPICNGRPRTQRVRVRFSATRL